MAGATIAEDVVVEFQNATHPIATEFLFQVSIARHLWTSTSRDDMVTVCQTIENAAQTVNTVLKDEMRLFLESLQNGSSAEVFFANDRNDELMYRVRMWKLLMVLDSGADLSSGNEYCTFAYVPASSKVIFLTSANGSGKTRFLNQYRAYLMREHKVKSEIFEPDRVGLRSPNRKAPNKDDQYYPPVPATDDVNSYRDKFAYPELHNTDKAPFSRLATAFHNIVGPPWTLASPVEITTFLNGRQDISRQDILRLQLLPWFARTENGRMVPFQYSEISDGLRQVFRVLLHFESFHSVGGNGFIFFDEPESSLHPALTRRLCTYLGRNLAEFERILLATHSLPLIMSMTYEVGEASCLPIFLRSELPPLMAGPTLTTSHTPTIAVQSRGNTTTLRLRAIGRTLGQIINPTRKDRTSEPIRLKIFCNPLVRYLNGPLDLASFSRVFEDLVGTTSTTLFCEGKGPPHQSAYDHIFLSSLFPTITVQAVNSSANVVAHVRAGEVALRDIRFEVTGVHDKEYWGIIDLDRGSVLASSIEVGAPFSVNRLEHWPVAELENIVMHPAILQVVGLHLFSSPGSYQDAVRRFYDRIRTLILDPSVRCNMIDEFIRGACSVFVSERISRVGPDLTRPDMSTLESLIGLKISTFQHIGMPGNPIAQATVNIANNKISVINEFMDGFEQTGRYYIALTNNGSDVTTFPSVWNTIKPLERFACHVNVPSEKKHLLVHFLIDEIIAKGDVFDVFLHGLDPAFAQKFGNKPATAKAAYWAYVTKLLRSKPNLVYVYIAYLITKSQKNHLAGATLTETEAMAIALIPVPLQRFLAPACP